MDKIKKVSDIKSMSDEELEGLFLESFNEQVVSYNDFGGETDFDIKIIRPVGNTRNPIKVEISMQGLAGSVSAEDFKKNKVKKASMVTISRLDRGSLSFRLLPQETVYKHSTEYTIVYISE